MLKILKKKCWEKYREF